MKQLKILSLFIFAFFLIGLVSAATVYADWEDSSQNIIITNGEKITFRADFISVNPPMTINIKLYNSNSELVYTFENAKVVNCYNFSNSYEITDKVYQNSGNYELILTVTDRINTDSHSLSLKINPVVVPDTTKPVITLIGENPINLTLGTPYTEYGATATDNVDGDITGKIIITNPVNVYALGTYIVRYNVKDSAGNSANEVTRTVNVVSATGTDTTAPVITILGSNPVTVNQGSTYVDAGATATDNVDGNITNRIVVTNNVNTNLAGTYTVTYTVQDTAGNSASATRTVNVVNGTEGDTTAPIITVIVPQASTYSSTNFTFHVETNENATVQFTLDNASNISMQEVNSNQFRSGTLVIPEGSHTVIFYATDSSGNTAFERVVFTVDLSSTKPVMNVIVPVEGKKYSSSSLEFKVTINEVAEIEFSLDGKNNVTMDLAGVQNGVLTFTSDVSLSEGSHTVVFYAQDTAGNIGSERVSFSVDTKRSNGKSTSNRTDVNFEEQLYYDQFNKKPTIYLTEDDGSKDKLTLWERFVRWLKGSFGLGVFLLIVGILALIFLIILLQLKKELNKQ